MSHPDERSGSSLNPEQVESFIRQHREERRGSFPARAVQVQKVNEFGKPNVAVLTMDQPELLTIAGIIDLSDSDEVMVYDDNAPEGPQYFYCAVESSHGARRPGDVIEGMSVVYLRKQEVGMTTS